MNQVYEDKKIVQENGKKRFLYKIFEENIEEYVTIILTSSNRQV